VQGIGDPAQGHGRFAMKSLGDFHLERSSFRQGEKVLPASLLLAKFLVDRGNPPLPDASLSGESDEAPRPLPIGAPPRALRIRAVPRRSPGPGRRPARQRACRRSLEVHHERSDQSAPLAGR
jgi:hypothetical protein